METNLRASSVAMAGRQGPSQPGRSQGRKLLFGRDFLCVLLLLTLGLLIGLPRCRSGIDLGDEGLLAYGAERVNQGQLPNRDFVSLQPPLSFYTAAAMFKIFGTSLRSLRVLGLGLYLFIPLLIYGIARNLVNPALSFATAIPLTVLGLPYFGFVPYAIWQGISATLAAVFLFVGAMRPGKRRGFMALSAGMMTAMSILLRHDQGLYVALSVLVYAMVLRFSRNQPVPRATLTRTFAWWLAGVAGVSVPSVAYWQLQGVLPQMFQQLIVFPITTYARTSSVPFPSFSSELVSKQNGIVCLYYFPPLIWASAAAWWLRRTLRGQLDFQEALVGLLLIWSALYYCQVLTRSDLNHLLITLPPFLILSAYCCNVLLERLNDKILKLIQDRRWALAARRAVAGLLGAAVLGYLCLTKPVFLPELPGGMEMVPLRPAGVRDELAQRLTNLVRKVQSNVPADRSILCLPYQPMFYFLCERRNPTRWNYLWPGDQTPEDHERLIQEAKHDPPAVVLIMSEDTMRQYAPAVLDYVHAEYRAVATNGELIIYLPGS